MPASWFGGAGRRAISSENAPKIVPLTLLSRSHPTLHRLGHIPSPIHDGEHLDRV
jgi:hypothetical protein